MPRHLRHAPYLYCGAGSFQLLPELLRQWNVTRPFAVVDDGVLASVGRDRLDPLNLVGLFSDTRPDPETDLVDIVAGQVRSSGADAVIGMGGGSAMDLAKAAAVMAKNPGPAVDYQGFHLVKKPGLPSFMLPTTAGTAAETTWSAVLVNTLTRRKGGINSVFVLPAVAILDAELTLSAPEEVFLASGMDAVTHAVESITSRNRTPLSEMYAREAAGLLLRNIPMACDPERRTAAVMDAMLLGSFMAGLAIGASEVGPTHALGYPLGVDFQIPHGMANAILLPHVMAFNAAACREEYAQVASLLGDAAGRSGESPARAMARFVTGLGLTKTLRSYGVTADDIDRLAEKGLQLRGPMDNAPRPVRAEDAAAIYRSALDSLEPDGALLEI